MGVQNGSEDHHNGSTTVTTFTHTASLLGWPRTDRALGIPLPDGTERAVPERCHSMSEVFLYAAHVIEPEQVHEEMQDIGVNDVK